MPSFVVIEEDFTDSKAHTYPRRRSHTIGSSNAEFHDVKKMNLLLLKCVWPHFRIFIHRLKKSLNHLVKYMYNIQQSTARKLLFEWFHHRILFTHSKFRVDHLVQHNKRHHRIVLPTTMWSTNEYFGIVCC